MKTTIFARMLLAALASFLVVLFLIIAAINTIVYHSGTDFARETAVAAARQYSRSLSEKITATDTMMRVVAGSLSNPDFIGEKDLYRFRAAIESILRGDPDVHSAWFAIEPGFRPDGRGLYQSRLRLGADLVEISNPDENDLADPERSPGYQRTLKTGQVHINLMAQKDFGLGRGPELIAEGSYPIWSDLRVVGSLGLNFKFDDLFNPRGLGYAEGQVFKLVAASGEVLSSSDKVDEPGESLFHYDFGDGGGLAAALGAGDKYFAEILSPVTGLKSFICLLPVELNLPGYEGLSLYMDIPLASLYARANHNLKLIYLVAFLGVVLLSLSIFAATGKVVRPIEALTADFQKLSEGDLCLPPRTGGGQSSRVVELDILEKSLRQMLEHIKLNHELHLKAAEEKIEKEKIIAASEARTAFFANLSHEIRTPMNAILGLAEIMLHDERLSRRQARRVQDIKDAAEALLGIVGEILDLSKLESGQLNLVPVAYDFQKLIGGVRTMAAHLAAGKNLAFTYEEEGAPPACLHGDDGRVRQILLNLISNAVKFTVAGGVTLRVKAEGETLVFQVIDSGLGIRPEDRGALFEPFSRLDLQRNRSIEGTGLGLSITRSLVEMMGGTIAVESEYGRGSVFTVTLPLIAGDPAKLDSEPDGPLYIYDSAARVLVVDDNAVNLTVAAGLLRTIFGLEPDQASSGPEAIEKAKKISYDLIFMDHMMPRMDGLEAAARIRALKSEYQKLPIVALTANAVKGAREMMLAAGLDDFLGKPLVKKELAAVLYKWLPAKYRRAIRPEEEAEGGGTVQLGRALWPAEVLREIDLASGLDQAAGQREVYQEMLSVSAGDLPLKAQSLEELLAAEDWPALAVEVHGLKSSLASLGARPLAELARELERAAGCAEKDFCRVNLGPFSRRLGKLGLELDRALSGGAALSGRTKAGQGFEAGRRAAGGAEVHLQRLGRALAGYDYGAIMEHLAAALGEADELLRGRLEEIKKRMRRFDYDGASEMMKDIHGQRL